MFCRKCGNEIPDDSVFCLKCGEKVTCLDKANDLDNLVSLQNEETKDNKPLKPDNSSGFESVLKATRPKQIRNKFSNLNKKTKRIVFGIIIFLLISIIVIIALINMNICNVCDNKTVEGSNYCYYHKCRVDGCEFSKSRDDKYCFSHEKEFVCAWEDLWSEKCNNDKIEGGDYCLTHTCDRSGCNEKISKEGYNTCLKHKVNMRSKITNSSFGFTLNSAGGIEFTFRATNSTSKTIKYIRFDVKLKNSVGDLVYDEIKDTNKVNVEIVGPINPGNRINMTDKIIGYCDDCARIDIEDITIIYTDGTTETGHFGYYAEK